MSNAVYYVYSDSACTDKVATLTTDANGVSNEVKLLVGTYYIKEQTASEGYAVNTTKYSGEVEADETTNVAVTETPQSDPISILLEKYDADTGESTPQGDGSLANAQFTIKYYDGYYTSSTLPSTATKTWVVKTNSNGIARLSDSYLVSGSLYTNSSGIPTIPLGTVSIQETKAPSGYKLNSTVYVRQITSSGTSESVTTYNEPEIPNSVIRGGVKVQKRDYDTNKTTAQGDATLKSATFKIINRSDESVVVNGKEYAVGAVVLTLTTDENGSATTDDDTFSSYNIITTRCRVVFTDISVHSSARDETTSDEPWGSISIISTHSSARDETATFCCSKFKNSKYSKFNHHIAK